MNARNENACGQAGEFTEEVLPKAKSIIGQHYGDVNNLNNTSTEAQRKRLLATLQKHPVTTYEARRDLEIWHPAMRVLELKKLGHDIDTVLIDQFSEDGVKHLRVAKYVLRSTHVSQAQGGAR